jgi:Protein of unknown function (DUF4058)/Protein of unknown function (DUF2934)
MQSPFPGMDPYLEDPALWPEFHRRLVETLRQLLAPGLIKRYRHRLGKRRYAGTEEPYLEVRQVADDRLVTLVDVVSLANKTTDVGRQAYLETRKMARDNGANLVEIDLLLQGKPLLICSRDGLPNWDYAVTLMRATQPERYELYTATLQKPLPVFRLPLARHDQDAVLDLQAAFTRCFEEGGYAERIDYRREPPMPLKEADGCWLDEMLKARRLRPFSHADIAVAAYYLWEHDGRPHGRDKEHWYKALAQLRRLS